MTSSRHQRKGHGFYILAEFILAPALSRQISPRPRRLRMVAVTGRSLLAPASSNEWQLYKLSVDGFAGHFHLNALARNAFAGNQHIAEALAKLCWIRIPIPRKARVLERLATISGWRGGLSRLPRNRIGELGSVSDLSLAYGHRPPVSPLLGAPSGVRQANSGVDSRCKSGGKEGVTSHFCREPCVGSREGMGEASVAERVGRANERRNS